MALVSVRPVEDVVPIGVPKPTVIKKPVRAIIPCADCNNDASPVRALDEIQPTNGFPTVAAVSRAFEGKTAYRDRDNVNPICHEPIQGVDGLWCIALHQKYVASGATSYTNSVTTVPWSPGQASHADSALGLDLLVAAQVTCVGGLVRRVEFATDGLDLLGGGRVTCVGVLVRRVGTDGLDLLVAAQVTCVGVLVRRVEFATDGLDLLGGGRVTRVGVLVRRVEFATDGLDLLGGGRVTRVGVLVRRVEFATDGLDLLGGGRVTRVGVLVRRVEFATDGLDLLGGGRVTCVGVLVRRVEFATDGLDLLGGGRSPVSVSSSVASSSPPTGSTGSVGAGHLFRVVPVLWQRLCAQQKGRYQAGAE